jgi:hypothetical protein
LARSLAGGNPGRNEEQLLVDDYTPTIGAIVPVADGFFYPGSTRAGTLTSFKFYDYATGKARDIYEAPASLSLGMSISSEGDELVYSAAGPGDGTDLVLLEFAYAPR